jgi:uncharacterized protein YjbI with pentapeptide repeats
MNGADLSRASLAGAFLGGANLKKAYLESANLANANFGRVSLRGAYLCFANLSATNLQFADLRGPTRGRQPQRGRPWERQAQGATLAGADLAVTAGLDLGRFITDLRPEPRKVFLDPQKAFLDSLSRGQLSAFNLSREKLARFRGESGAG